MHLINVDSQVFELLNLSLNFVAILTTIRLAILWLLALDFLLLCVRPLVAPLLEMKFDFSDQGDPEEDHVGQHHEQDNKHDDPAQVKLLLCINHIVCEPGQWVRNEQNAELVQDFTVVH